MGWFQGDSKGLICTWPELAKYKWRALSLFNVESGDRNECCCIDVICSFGGFMVCYYSVSQLHAVMTRCMMAASAVDSYSALRIPGRMTARASPSRSSRDTFDLKWGASTVICPFSFCRNHRDEIMLFFSYTFSIIDPDYPIKQWVRQEYEKVVSFWGA